VELEAYSQAVKYYSVTSAILKRYDNLPSFQTIQKDCEEIVKDLQNTLNNKMQDPKSPSPMVTEAVTLLFELNRTQPPSQLRVDYLNRFLRFFRCSSCVLTQYSRKVKLRESLNDFSKTITDEKYVVLIIVCLIVVFDVVDVADLLKNNSPNSTKITS